MKQALIIMSKLPEPGFVKTRLRPFLTDQGCASLAGALLSDSESKAADSGVATVFAVSPVGRIGSFAGFLEKNQTLIEQTGSNLGAKMHNAFADVLADGTESAVMIGTDCPFVSAGEIVKALSLLSGDNDAVIGPSEDGGFYLIGLKAANIEIFKRVDWSTSKTFVQTMENLKRIGLTTHSMSVLYDIDREKDIRRLFEDKEFIRQTNPATFEWLSANSHLFKMPS